MSLLLADGAVDRAEQSSHVADAALPSSGDAEMAEAPHFTGVSHAHIVAQREREQLRAAQLKELQAAVDSGEKLSKNAAKRLNRLQHKGERREKAKAERLLRRQARRGKADVADSVVTSASTAPAPAVEADPVAAEARGAEHHAAAWEFWRRIGAPRTVLAPMVNQSELAFRLLARERGAELCFTPMLHSTLFAEQEAYRKENFESCAHDRPLVTQFCGDDPATLLAAARLAQAECDAIDLNCGCPQAIARRGHYGAFLLDEPELIVRIVRTLAAPGALHVPVCVKMRLLPSLDDTLALATALQAAGASVLTVHGRTREQKCRVPTDWAAIGAIKAALSIPVIANGGIERPEDIGACLAATGADAVMVSEAALENPGIFGGVGLGRGAQLALARRYLELARRFPPRATSVVKAHLFKLLYLALQTEECKELRNKLGAAVPMEEIVAQAQLACDAEEAALRAAPDAAAQRCDEDGAGRVSWYRRHRPYDSSAVPFAKEGKLDADEGGRVSLDEINARQAQARAAQSAGGAPPPVEAAQSADGAP